MDCTPATSKRVWCLVFLSWGQAVDQPRMLGNYGTGIQPAEPTHALFCSTDSEKKISSCFKKLACVDTSIRRPRIWCVASRLRGDEMLQLWSVGR